MNAPDLMIIKDLSDERWLSWIKESPQANLFHHPVWMNLLAESYGYHPFIGAIPNENGEILAGIPMMEISSPLGSRRWVSLPFTDYCTTLYKDQQSVDLLVKGLIASVYEKRTSKIELRCEIPTNPSWQASAQYKLHTLKLEEDFNKVASHFDRIHRQNVRQAEKNLVRVEWGKQLDDIRKYYELQLVTRRRHGVPSQPWKYFKLISERLIEKGFGSVLLAYHDDQCIAGMILLNWQQSIICKYAASREGSMKLRPNNLLFWTAIRWGCENGFKVFDMGRTDMDNPGLMRFKQDWGADEIPLTYYTAPIKKQNQTSSRMLALMKPIIQKSPLWVCRAIGEVFYRYAG